MGWRIVASGMGGFMDPPGAPSHSHSVEDGPAYNPSCCMSLESALAESYVPEHIKARVRGIIAQAEITYPESWVRSVYAYFACCYSPDGVDRNVSNCIVDRSPTFPVRDPARHLGVLFIRRWLPEHEPRMDLIYGLES